MSTLEIILAVLSSSILTTILTLGGSWYFTRLSFKNEYYKEIIKRRLNGYEELESTAALFIQSYRINPGEYCPIIFYYGYEDFCEYWRKISDAVGYSVWVNEKTLEILAKLGDLISEADRKFNLNDSSTDEEVIQAGVAYHDRIFKASLELENAIRKDMLGLYKVKKYLNRKNSNSKRT